MGDAAQGIKAFREGLKDDKPAEKPAEPVVLTAARARRPARRDQPLILVDTSLIGLRVG